MQSQVLCLSYAFTSEFGSLHNLLLFCCGASFLSEQRQNLAFASCSNHRACFGSSLLNFSVIVLRFKLFELPLELMHSGGRLLNL